MYRIVEPNRLDIVPVISRVCERAEQLGLDGDERHEFIEYVTRWLVCVDHSCALHQRIRRLNDRGLECELHACLDEAADLLNSLEMKVEEREEEGRSTVT